jgi:hypothetical protein
LGTNRSKKGVNASNAYNGFKTLQHGATQSFGHEGITARRLPYPKWRRNVLKRDDIPTVDIFEVKMAILPDLTPRLTGLVVLKPVRVGNLPAVCQWRLPVGELYLRPKKVDTS